MEGSKPERIFQYGHIGEHPLGFIPNHRREPQESGILSKGCTVTHLDSECLYYGLSMYLKSQLRPPRGVCEPHHHKSYKPFVIGAIPSQTYGDVWGWCP